MNRKSAFLAIAMVAFVSFAFGANRQKPNEAEVVKLQPCVVMAKSLANADFSFVAKFRYHLIWAGIKELVIIRVGKNSDAKKAGLAVGEKIIQIREVKVEGMGLKELQREFEMKTETGKVQLVIQAKDSTKTRIVELQFGEPAIPEPNQPITPTPLSAAPTTDAPSR